MSRSRKLAIYKDKGLKKLYWRIIRSHTNQIIRNLKNDPDLEIPDPKSIINDYDYCDYVIDYEFGWRRKSSLEELRRK